MSHFAQIIDGLVARVIVAEQDFIDTLPDAAAWIQTSYNTRGGVHFGPDGQPDGGAPMRYNYAGIGYTYDATRDAFIPPRPYPSWVLDEETCLWAAPVPYPQDGEPYAWDEAAGAWVGVSSSSPNQAATPTAALSERPVARPSAPVVPAAQAASTSLNSQPRRE